MKLSEIKTKLDNGDYTVFDEIQIKSYLPIVSKMIMILGFDKDEIHYNGILDECLEVDKSGMVYINHFKKEMNIVCSIVAYYTDIEVDEIEYEDTLYDYYITSGIWNKIENRMLISEHNSLFDLIEKSIQEELRKCNSIEGIVAKGLSKVVDKIPDSKQMKSITKSIVKDVNGFSGESKTFIQNIVSNFTNKVTAKVN